MKHYLLVIPPDIQSYIRNLHPQIKSKIRRALEEISKNPEIGKLLEDQLVGFYSYRVDQYRIVYSIHHEKIQVEIVDIDKRSIIYSKLEKFILDSK